ncbi:inorganic diphosphatase [Thraustotheca clavata]|uniref:Inorganic diphosphatase n=1 Tax=Thraustotheca clavata TaxID=74557 RepID=A0A1V9ZI91_9STRA|nr:inorganic diphosphatase [Thraustotheca clavata]
MGVPASDAQNVSMAATMLGSAMAGILGRVVCHPMDMAKANLQVHGMYRNAWHVLTDTLKAEGIRGLYKGFGVIVLGSAPATCLYMTSYEESKKWLNSFPMMKNSTFLSSFTAGIVAEAFSCVFWVPIDVIKERMQVQRVNQANAYKNVWHAFQTISRTEGLRGMYKGYGATMWSFGPYSALFFVSYEQNKALAEKFHKSKDVPFPSLLLCSVSASAAASFFTNPLDLVKLRLQVERFQIAQNNTTAQYNNTLQGLRRIIANEGVLALWKGAGARIAFQAPLTGITIALYEKCKTMCARIV